MSSTLLSKNKIKEIIKLQYKKYREKSGLFIAEGEKILDEMIEYSIDIVQIYSKKELNTDIKNYPISIISECDMKKISTTQTPCEILTIARQKSVPIEAFRKLNNLILLDSISDPGNLGTIIRSASAFGIEGIILFANCTDLYSSKVIRSTAGNLFKLPIVHIKSIEEFENNFGDYTKIAATIKDKNNINIKDCLKFQRKIIMFGSEACGLNPILEDNIYGNLKLPMRNNVESLNLAVCASIIMYETMR